MTPTDTREQTRERRPLRLWPGVASLILLWFIWLVIPAVFPEAAVLGVLGALVGALAILVWWIFFSRVPRIERWGALVLMIAAAAATPPILHRSIAGGMMGMMFYIYVIPVVTSALVVWALATQWLPAGLRRAALALAILVACASFASLRTDGITGGGRSQLAWRWSTTPEQQLLARPASELTPRPPVDLKEASPKEIPASPATAVAPLSAATSPASKPASVPAMRDTVPNGPFWPGFRGPHRDSTVAGVRIKTDWTSSAPVEMWRRAVGPGWSSFAIRDGLLYTQEQRGEFEVVACYKAATGEPVWTHRDTARFWESNAGAGPRATPTTYGGRVYTFGATGILNALDARSGAVVWSRKPASDTGAKLPGWGFASSPLVIDDLVIVAAAGRLAAYHLPTGDQRWVQKEGGAGYSSPQMLTIGGVAQVVLLNGAGATSVTPSDGKVLWKHAWEGVPMLQPALTEDGGVLITSGDMSGGMGTRRLAVEHGPGGWTATEVWTSRGLKPYFNDLVVHNGHAFGFDGGILSCIDLRDGSRKWKGGRYGHGQLLLLPDQDLLLVLSEEGELALVGAVPGQFTEIARVRALEGKTWNHPALAGDLLLVRNGQEMVAFKLPLAGG